MAKEYAKDYTINELIAAFISHELDDQDGQEVRVGAAQPVLRAGVLLAHLTRCPNMRPMVSLTWTNLLNVDVLEPFQLSTDWRAAKWAEAYVRHDELFIESKSNLKQVFFVGAIQVDKYGNTNLIGVGEDYKKLKFRAAGPIGTTTRATYVGRYYILTTSHTKRIFVEKCDFISCVGWAEGGKDARKRLGLPGGGPKYCITPFCIMDFEEESKRMRLKSLHPGISLDQVVQNTGFELIIPKEIPTTEPPTVEEIELLRTKIDVEGFLRK